MKRLFDIVSAGTLLLLLSPLLLVVFILQYFLAGRPLFFRQQRIGRHGKPFYILKLRTLRALRTGSESDAQRLTRWGQFLRSTSIDELPELWNVLRGEMSLVGPRPLLTHYLPRYTTDQARRHTVLPGITGWAQINGRNAISWERQFKLDLWYVENHSFWLDLKILMLTPLSVLRRKNVTEQGHATRSEFLGNEENSQGKSLR